VAGVLCAVGPERELELLEKLLFCLGGVSWRCWIGEGAVRVARVLQSGF
jgi:hypothetical protein